MRRRAYRMPSPPKLEGATVLLTGALGFLGKVVLERLLASSKPVKCVLLLLRPKHGYSAQERLNHAKTRPCFAHLPPSVPRMFKFKIHSIQHNRAI